MTEDKLNPANLSDARCMPPDEDEINLLDYWHVIWKWRKLISKIVAVIVLLTIIISLFMTNIYESKAVILPVKAKELGGGGGLAALAQQFGGVADLPIGTPGSASAAEIMGLLKSNIIREKMIRQYNLMPILFYKKWDKERQTWKKGGALGFSLNPLTYMSMLAEVVSPAPSARIQKKDPDVPDMWDALRLLDKIINIKKDIKENNTITITVEFADPEMSAKLLGYLLSSLNDHMSSEAKRVATTNRKYLEEQLATSADPFIKQKTYNLIAEQIETAMMAEVKENFAFKVIDPPLPPDKKLKPKRAQMAILSVFVALFIGIFTAFFMEYLGKIKNKRTPNT
ncbi:MAG: Wzz/FepE/Etk N-terminal domain-containing protein [Syntrophales bacterium]|nr:Wzz/FepE/Etk N-terminal domain-containing protein [Syntrophales bacterium]